MIEEWRRACTLELRDNVLKCCQQRDERNSNDVWALAVQGRLEACHDLPAEEAIYHKNCHTRFMLGRGQKSEGLERGPGEDETKKKLFDGMCEWLPYGHKVV